MSNSRYTNAGDVGAGTVINNMASRVKAWAKANTNGPTLLASFGVSSYTDTSVGQSAFTMTNPMASAEYSLSGIANSPGVTNAWGQASVAPTTSVVYIGSITPGPTAVEATVSTVQVCGTLA